MLNDTLKKPGRQSTIARHPRRHEIELACAAGLSLRDVAEHFGVTRASVDRYWHALPQDERTYLTTMAQELEEHQASLRRVFASAMARARSSPVLMPGRGREQGHAHAA
ncbi:helix-turn-helix domain-containing protein [Methylobacterium flocculans]|uniref:helix-turn-helix domain-containing protein n=1 Tax=Methylobacterium flocculans TaxID=2984843 RepID=UPI0021F28D2A|nr:helix-turn-helix domain-containing protein [Methylobacterium sp. FF17]